MLTTYIYIFFQIRSTTTSNRLTNSTKSRISSIFSSTVDSIGDDDPFDLKASARKLKPIRESIVNTGRLVDIDFAEWVFLHSICFLSTTYLGPEWNYYLVASNFKWKIFSNFVAFSEYPNFNKINNMYVCTWYFCSLPPCGESGASPNWN